MRAFVLALMLLAGGAAGAWADMPASGAPAEQRLLLEIWINGFGTHTLAWASVTGQKIVMRAADLRSVGVQLPLQEENLDLARVEGVSATIDLENQRLLLTVAAARLPVQKFDLNAPVNIPTMSSRNATGAVLRYDLSATADDAARLGRTASGGLSGGLDFFTPTALVSVTGFAAADRSGAHGARLDTNMEFDRPESLDHLIAGDVVAAGPEWARGVRLGGVEYASDFSIRPDLVTMPLPAYFGQSQVPATVEVFSGAARVFQQEVQPGPFELRNLPIVTGGGTATVVTRDILGRETSQVISLYTAPNLLAPGLSSYAIDGGFLRTGYGISSFGYDTPLVSGTYRLGLDGNLTAQTHGEAAPHLAMLGAGLAGALGNFGTLSFDLAGSGSDPGAGYMAAFSAAARQDRFNLDLSVAATSSGFRDLASIGGAPPPRLRVAAEAGVNFGTMGALNVGWIGSRVDSNNASDYATASYSMPLPNGAFLAFTGLKDLNSRGFDAQITITIPLGKRALASVSAEASDHNGTYTAMYDSPANADGGLGYRALAEQGGSARTEGDVTWIGRHAAVDGAVSLLAGRTAVRSDVSGALVAMDGEVFTSHDPGSAVALVETGAANIRVFRENRGEGRSDAEGKMLLTNLDPYAANHVSVDPRDYSFDQVVENADALVRPRKRSGAIVNLAPAAHHPVIAVIAREDGLTSMAPGAHLTLAGSGQSFIVGRGGEVFIPDLPSATDAVVEYDGVRCDVRIAAPARTGMALPRTDPLACVPEARHAA